MKFHALGNAGLDGFHRGCVSIRPSKASAYFVAQVLCSKVFVICFVIRLFGKLGILGSVLEGLLKMQKFA